MPGPAQAKGRRMTRTIEPIRRAIITLDQSSGELRSAGMIEDGLDLWPSTGRAFADARGAGLEIIVTVPGPIDPDAAAAAGQHYGVAFASADDGLQSAMAAFDGSAVPTALVSADRRQRGEAMGQGLHPAPHVALLPMMMEGELADALRLVGPAEVLARLALANGIVPMHFQPNPSGQWALIGLADSRAQAAVLLSGIQVSLLPCDPMTDDLLWARIERDTPEVRAALKGHRIIHAEPGQLLVALGPDQNAEALHVHGAHGHSELLVPSPELLSRPTAADAFANAIETEALPDDIFERVADAAIGRLRVDCTALAASYESDLDRYTSVSPLDANGPIISRHTAHADNKRAEAGLLADLKAIGYCAHRHNFTHAGRTHSNIIADLPGAGYFRIRPPLFKRYLEIIGANPPPGAIDPLGPETEALAPQDATPDAQAIDDRQLRERIERASRLRPWYPPWKPPCPLAGFGADLVIVGCHLDSTAGFDPGYAAATDPAPGRDDDASGLAAVLAMARYFWPARGRLRHTIRFCFFNAEESGLVGSKAYAARLKALGAPIKAVLCLDMIGHNSDEHRFFEIHVGHTDPAIRDLSLPLAGPIADAAAAHGTLAPAQVYAGTSWSGAPDRSVFDGAINRSDHAAFHQQGYPAALVSEDFFANLAGEPGADPNPNYHRGADTHVDLVYAHAILCAVAHAAVRLAR